MRLSPPIIGFILLASVLSGCSAVRQPQPSAPEPPAAGPTAPDPITDASRRQLRIDGRELWVSWGSEAAQRAMVLHLDQLPAMVRPWGAPLGSEFGPGRDGFSTAVFDPAKGRIAFGSHGVHGFLGVVDLSVEAGTLKGRLKPLDLIYGGAIRKVQFSPDGAYLAVEAVRPSGFAEVNLWRPAWDKVVITGVPRLAEMRIVQFEPARLRITLDNAPWSIDLATGKASKA